MAEEENTVINVQLEVDTKNLEKELTKAHQQAQKTAKAQVGSEKQSVASQKTASRIADTTRRDSNRDMANQTRSKRLAEQREERVRRAERGHEKESKKSFRERAKHYAEATKQRREEVRAARQLRDIETDTVKRRNKQGAFASRGGGGSSGGGGSAAGGMGMGRMAVGAAGAIGGLAVAGIGAYIGAALTQLNDGVQLYKKYATSKADLTGMSGVARLDDPEIIRRGERMGYSKLDTAQQAGTIGRQTGRIGATATAQEFSRASGATFDQVGSTMGTLTRAGQQFDERGGGAGRRQMAMMFRDAVTSGLDRSRTGEHLEAVSSIIQDVGGRTAGDVNAGGISSLLAWLGSTGKSGFQGARGANFMAGIDSGIRSGGNDDSSRAMVLQSMGFGFGGDEEVSYVEALRRQERGVFGAGGGENLDRVMETFKRQSGGGEEQLLAMRKSGVFGDATIDQLDDFRKEYERALATGDRSGINGQLEAMQAQGVDIQTQILEATKGGNLKMVEHLAAMDNRSLEHGEALIQSVMDMENLFNRLMDWGIPTMISGINAIADIAMRVADGLGFGGSKAESDKNIGSLEDRSREVLHMSGTEGARERQKLLEAIDTEQRVGMRGLTSDSDYNAASRRLSDLRRRVGGGIMAHDPSSNLATQERDLQAREMRRADERTAQQRRDRGQAPLAGPVNPFDGSGAGMLRVQVTSPVPVGTQPANIRMTTNQQTGGNGIVWNTR